MASAEWCAPATGPVLADLPGPRFSQLVVTGPGTGAPFYSSAGAGPGETYLTRFRYGATLQVSPAAQLLTPTPTGFRRIPRHAFAVDVDHVLVVDAGGEARCWTLAP